MKTKSVSLIESYSLCDIFDEDKNHRSQIGTKYVFPQARAFQRQLMGWQFKLYVISPVGNCCYSSLIDFRWLTSGWWTAGEKDHTAWTAMRRHLRHFSRPQVVWCLFSFKGTHVMNSSILALRRAIAVEKQSSYKNISLIKIQVLLNSHFIIILSMSQVKHLK